MAVICFFVRFQVLDEVVAKVSIHLKTFVHSAAIFLNLLKLLLKSSLGLYLRVHFFEFFEKILLVGCLSVELLQLGLPLIVFLL